MENPIINPAVVETIIRDGTWLLIIAGWVFLLITGLEADKPLSGGIPGHVNPNEERNAPSEGFWGRFGEKSAWVVFAFASALLPVILWWILTTRLN
ncbi:MAG: hypothetical protein M3Q45_01075 [Chloroflexota bacterium]|nr:hypothetical protein [Chloroflexota bacterium]